MLRSDDDERRFQPAAFLQMRNHLANRFIHEHDIPHQGRSGSPDRVLIPSGWSALLNQLLSDAHRLEIHSKNGGHGGLGFAIVSLAVNFIEDSVDFQRVVAGNVLEAASIVAGIRRIGNRRAGYARGGGHRQSHHRRIHLRSVVVIDVRAITRARNRQVGRMFVGPRGVTSRGMDDSENRVHSDEVPGINRRATLAGVTGHLGWVK
jgi:hypothetical protein